MPVAILECAVTSCFLGWRWLRVLLAEDPKTAFELDPVAFESPVNPDHMDASCEGAIVIYASVRSRQRGRIPQHSRRFDRSRAEVLAECTALTSKPCRTVILSVDEAAEQKLFDCIFSPLPPQRPTGRRPRGDVSPRST